MVAVEDRIYNLRCKGSNVYNSPSCGVVHSGTGSYAHFHDAFLFLEADFSLNIIGRGCYSCLAVPACLSVFLSVLSIGSGFLIFGSEI